MSDTIGTLIVIAVVIWVLTRTKAGACCAACARGGGGEQSHPKADDKRPAAPGVRAAKPPGCSPFACGR